jgi:hypothetical protein
MSFGINKAQLREMITGCSFADGKDFGPLSTCAATAVAPTSLFICVAL